MVGYSECGRISYNRTSPRWGNLGLQKNVESFHNHMMDFVFEIAGIFSTEVSILFSYKEANIDDLPQVVTLFCQFVYEVKEISNDPYFNFDALSNEGTLEWMRKAVHEGRVKIYVAKRDEDIIGFISGSITPWQLNTVCECNEFI